MDIRKIKKLIELLHDTDVAEIEISEGEESVRITRGSSNQVVLQSPQTNGPTTSAPPQPIVSMTVEDVAPATTAPSGHHVKSPMVGTFYSKPSPEEPPFVIVGQEVKKGDTLCLIEVMKLFTAVECTADGTVEMIFAEDGALVEFDQPLFSIA